MIRSDLHTHSSYSDGSLSPNALVALAKEKGLHALSITDHDTFQGYFEAKDRGMPILPGVEVSAEFEGQSVHVLAYAFNPSDSEFYDFCFTQRKNRLERNREICLLLSKQGFALDESDIIDSDDPNKTYGRVHIAQAMLKKGYVADLLEAFKRFIGNKCPCYFSGKKWSVLQTIQAIHKAGGKAVLAHPHLLGSHLFARKLLNLPFDGLEAYYGRFPQGVNEQWVKMAHEKGVFVTGGSDFHGAAKPEVQLGSSFAPIEIFDMLYTHFHELPKVS